MYVVKVLEVSDDGRHEGCGGEVWLDDGVYCSLCGKVMPLEPLPSSPPVPFQGLDGPPGTDALEPLKGSDGPPVVFQSEDGQSWIELHANPPLSKSTLKRLEAQGVKFK